jgi:hypothetical protein
VSRYRKSATATALLLGAATLSGCAAVEPTASDNVVRSAAVTPSDAVAAPDVTVPVSPVPATTVTVTTSPSAKKPTKRGPRIVYLRIAQKPKCAEGTAVFRADPVPLIIEWKITGATGGALSVDDPTNTPGTYGPVELKGSQEFMFSCSGEVGSKETHTYALYTVGNGKVRSKTITASATVLDKGLGAN